MKNTSPITEEARFDRNKAVRIWKKVVDNETRLDLLRTLRKENIGTRNVENFLVELREEKNVNQKPKGSSYPGGVSQGKTNKT